MIDDYLLDLAADCYVALRAGGYLQEFPTFESFLHRSVGLERRRRLAGSDFRGSVADLVAAPPPAPIGVN